MGRAPDDAQYQIDVCRRATTARVVGRGHPGRTTLARQTRCRGSGPSGRRRVSAFEKLILMITGCASDDWEFVGRETNGP